jgi:hypothetical protein
MVSADNLHCCLELKQQELELVDLCEPKHLFPFWSVVWEQLLLLAAQQFESKFASLQLFFEVLFLYLSWILCRFKLVPFVPEVLILIPTFFWFLVAEWDTVLLSQCSQKVDTIISGWSQNIHPFPSWADFIPSSFTMPSLTSWRFYPWISPLLQSPCK